MATLVWDQDNPNPPPLTFVPTGEDLEELEAVCRQRQTTVKARRFVQWEAIRRYLKRAEKALTEKVQTIWVNRALDLLIGVGPLWGGTITQKSVEKTIKVSYQRNAGGFIFIVTTVDKALATPDIGALRGFVMGIIADADTWAGFMENRLIC